MPNKKTYVGVTKRDLRLRFSNGQGYRHNKSLLNDIKKLGWENVEKILLFDNLDKETAEEKEKEYIDFYKSNQLDKGYNKTTGGFKGGNLNKDSVQKTDYTKFINNLIKYNLTIEEIINIYEKNGKEVIWKRNLQLNNGDN